MNEEHILSSIGDARGITLSSEMWLWLRYDFLLSCGDANRQLRFCFSLLLLLSRQQPRLNSLSSTCNIGRAP